MEYRYKKAALEDLSLLVESRVTVLRSANHLDSNTDMSAAAAQSRSYYQKAIPDGSHIAYLVFDGDILIGTGGISFYRVMPTYHNLTGEKAYIMNLYTDPRYRRRGIALRTLHLLVSAAKARGVSHISLEATEMGRPLYETYGFLPMENEMELPIV